ncbi:MAG TPA: acyl--CoA ligase [Candidatus Anaerobiospirillum stercoravium]|nr:acyl--CoA ligase [Candidatus Anaerobiospirillum stercoravium]
MISFDHQDPSSALGQCPDFPTLLHALVHHARTKPQGLGLADATRRLTFAQWALRVWALQHLLEPELTAAGVTCGCNHSKAQSTPNDLTVTPGAAVLLPALPQVDYLCLYYALCLCQVIVVPCDPNSTAATLDYYAQQSGAQVLLDYGTPMASAAIQSLDITALLLKADALLPQLESDAQATLAAMAAALPSPKAYESIYFTSGTTGKSKAVLLTHANTLHGGLNSVSTCAKFSSDIEILTTPIFHAQAASSFRANLILGAASVLFPSFYRPEELQALINQYQCNALNLVPATLKLLNESLGDAEFCQLLSPLRLIEVGTAPTDSASKRHYSTILPHTWFLYNYGATECSRTVFNLVCGDYLARSEHSAPPGFVYGKNHQGQCFATNAELSALGRPVPLCQAKVLDDSGNELPCGTPGRLVFAGGMVMQGYLHQPELTAQTISPGRYYSSDCGYLDEYGFIHILGRIDDVINMGGEKISPQEIEDAVLGVPGIAECCCIGGEDALLGVIPVLYYTVKADAELTESSLKQALRRTLDRSHRPKIYVQQTSLPKNHVGKVDRKALKQLWQHSAAYRNLQASRGA